MPLGQQYLRLVLSRWKLVFGLVLGCTLAGLLFSTLILARNPTFESAARLNIVPTSEELGYANRFVRGSTFDGGSVLLQTYAEFAHTVPVVAPIVDRYIAEQAAKSGQTPTAWINANSLPSMFSVGRMVSWLNYGETPRVPLRQDLIDNVIKNTKIETVEGTYLLRIGVEWDDPQSAAWFANALTDAIIARAETMSRSSGSQIAGSLETRLQAKKAELAELRRRSREMKSAIGVVDLDRQKTALLEAQMAEQSRLTSDRAELQSSQSQVAGLRKQTGGKMSSSQAMVEQTLALEGPKASGLAQGLAVRQARLGQIGTQIATLAKHEIAIKTIDDQAAALQTEVAALTERVSFSQTENLANAPRIQLVERASPPLQRSSPKTLFNTALGFIAGCALAGCALLLLGGAPVARKQAFAGDDTPAPAPAPTFRESHAPVAGSAGVSGNLAVSEPERFAESTSAPEAQPVPLSPALRLVASAPRPMPISHPGVATASETAPAAHLMPNLLPCPADGLRYSKAEVASHGQRIARWLSPALPEKGGALLIAASGADQDARRFYQLLRDYLAQQGRRVCTLDGTAGPLPALDRDDRLLLIYGGGFAEQGRLAILREIEADTALVLVVGMPTEQAVLAELESSSRSYGGMAGKQPYAIAIRA